VFVSRFTHPNTVVSLKHCHGASTMLVFANGPSMWGSNSMNRHTLLAFSWSNRYGPSFFHRARSFICL
jgi:hypothetical protein